MPLQLQALNGSYATVRRFLPALLNGITFEGSPSAKPLPDAWHFLQPRLPDEEHELVISELSWDGQAVLDEVARRVQATLGEVAGEQGLLLDECGWEKAGSRSVGWAASTSGRWACLPGSAGAARRGWWAGNSTCPGLEQRP